MTQPNLRSKRPWLNTFCAALLIVCLVLVSGLLPRPTATAATVPGDITTNITWTVAGSPYLVNTPITIVAQATLTIEPGVEIRFAPGALLRVEGGLVARGTHARQITLAGVDGQSWGGIVVAQPASDIVLQSVAISQATAGLTLQQTGNGRGKPGPRLTILDSVFTSNSIGVDANYSSTNDAPRLSIRNTLFSGNQIGLQVTDVPTGPLKLKLQHNSFTNNGLGLRATGKSKLRVKQHWWGSEQGPIVSCTPRTLPNEADRVCGESVDFRSWSRVPAGRVFISKNGAATVQSAVGTNVESDDEEAPTSLVTVSVPAGTFSQDVDLITTARAASEMPGNYPGQATALFFEITAVANGQEIHTFAGNQPIIVEVAYLPQDLSNTDPSTLAVYYFNEATGRWSTEGITTSVDPANQRITARFDHLSRVGIMRSMPNQTPTNVFFPLVTREGP